MRILLASLPQALSLHLHTLLQHEPWVTAAFIAGGQLDADPADSYERWCLERGHRLAGPELIGQISATQADLVVLDWQLATALAWRTIERVRHSCPATGIIALNVSLDERGAAYSAGADLLLGPAERPEEIVGSLRVLGAGVARTLGLWARDPRGRSRVYSVRRQLCA